MVRVIKASISPHPHAWVFNQNNTCPECGTVYRIERSDRCVSGWWFELMEAIGRFPTAKWTNHGNGPVRESPYMLHDYLQGVYGPWVLSCCIECGGYCYTAAEGSE